MSVEDVVNESKARLEALLAPINGGVGEDISYDETFEAMKAEVDKLQAIDGGKIDWSMLVSSGETLLSDRSKDFRVALYYAAGQGGAGGLTGVLDGLVCLAELTTAFWEPMYPPLKRPKARGNLVGWYSDTVGPLIGPLNPGPKDRDLCLAIDQVSRALDADFRDKLGEAYPGVSALREGVRGLVARAPAEPAPPPPPPPPPSAAQPSGESDAASAANVEPQQQQQASYQQAPQSSRGGGPTADDITDIPAALRVLDLLAPLLSKSADVVLREQPADANGFRFGRLAAWIAVSESPPDEGGRTRVEPPIEHVSQGIQDLLAASNWEGLANTADMAAMQYPFWLDAVRHLVTALENLGETHQRARNVVVRELASLLARAPNLPDLSFDDGRPFADDETKAWIASTVLAGGGGGGGGGAVARSPVDKAVGDAKKMVAEGQIVGAMGLLTRAIAQAAVPAQRFKGRLELAKICIDNGLVEIASAQLESLEKVADWHRLMDWDPQLCTDLYANLYRVRRDLARMSNDPEAQTKLSVCFERLCQLDAAEALRILQS